MRWPFSRPCNIPHYHFPANTVVYITTDADGASVVRAASDSETYGEEAPAWVQSLQQDLRLILDQQEIIMFDTSRLKAGIEQLTSRNSAMVSALVALRDSNVQQVAKLADLEAKLAAMPQDTAELEQTLNQMATDVESVNAAIEQALTANPQTETPPPAPEPQTDQ